jgi:hypothetical protein
MLKDVRWVDDDAIAHDPVRTRDNVTGTDETRLGQFTLGLVGLG